MNPPLGIVVALSREARSIPGVNPCLPKQAQRLSSNCYLFISGMGKDSASSASQSLIDIGCKHLLSWGCCAALHSSLKPGDVLIPESISAGSASPISLTQPRLDTLQRLKQQGVNIVHGRYSDCDKLLATSEAKTNLHQLSSAIAADMESYAIAETAKQHDVSCSIVRAVSDDVHFSMPATISRCIDEYGNTNMPEFVFSLFSNPLQIASLCRLGIGFNRALNSLHKASSMILDSSSPAIHAV